jgi:hypothetical protein
MKCEACGQRVPDDPVSYVRCTKCGEVYELGYLAKMSGACAAVVQRFRGSGVTIACKCGCAGFEKAD